MVIVCSNVDQTLKQGECLVYWSEERAEVDKVHPFSCCVSVDTASSAGMRRVCRGQNGTAVLSCGPGCVCSLL